MSVFVHSYGLGMGVGVGVVVVLWVWADVFLGGGGGECMGCVCGWDIVFISFFSHVRMYRNMTREGCSDPLRESASLNCRVRISS